MNTARFLDDLRMRDVHVWAEDERLRVNGPERVLTPELQGELRARKLEILTYLTSRPTTPSSLVPIHPAGSHAPFYAVPGRDGDVFCYVELARRLGPEQPFYAFQAPGVDGLEPPMTSIERLASRYLADLRAHQPEGPYFLGGFCLGGMVAFELARQLRARGQDVGLLALFESPSPNGLRLGHRAAAVVRYWTDAASRRCRVLANQSWAERRGFVRARVAAAFRRERALTALGWHEARMEAVSRATIRAAHAYAGTTRPYDGRVVLFLSSERASNVYGRPLDWARVAARGLEVSIGPEGCTDYVMMLRDGARVRDLAARLAPYLDAHARDVRTTTSVRTHRQFA